MTYSFSQECEWKNLNELELGPYEITWELRFYFYYIEYNSSIIFFLIHF